METCSVCLEEIKENQILKTLSCDINIILIVLRKWFIIIIIFILNVQCVAR